MVWCGVALHMPGRGGVLEVDSRSCQGWSRRQGCRCTPDVTCMGWERVCVCGGGGVLHDKVGLCHTMCCVPGGLSQMAFFLGFFCPSAAPAASRVSRLLVSDGCGGCHAVGTCAPVHVHTPDEGAEGAAALQTWLLN